MNKQAIKIIGKKCTGCFGCYNICPNNAIKMKYNNEGFLFPFLIKENCNNCGTCSEICPVINTSNNKNRLIPKTFAVWNKISKIHNHSSSGGVFYELARYVLLNNGVVYGVGWDIDYSVKHIRITKISDIKYLMGSKYLQSNVGFSYKHVLKDLNNKLLVLFSGTPCQVAGLKNLSKKDSNLITVEVICHGIPSQFVFNKYLKYKFANKKITHIDFRNKTHGWKNYCIKIDFEKRRKYLKYHAIDEFFFGYLKNYYLNLPCYECKFSGIPRVADITLGDFWNIQKNSSKKLGISLVLLNNIDSDAIFEKCLNLDKIPKSFSYAIKGNPRIVKGTYQNLFLRNRIINDLIKHDFKFIKKKYFLPLFWIKKIIFYFDLYLFQKLSISSKGVFKIISRAFQSLIQ